MVIWRQCGIDYSTPIAGILKGLVNSSKQTVKTQMAGISKFEHGSYPHTLDLPNK